ncbi:hypothetical protein Tco_1219362 [Tanacetum coccineum]
MLYPRFTKVIINHFISKDKTISIRNRINLHTIRDDSLLGTLKYVSKTKDYQKYGALIPEQVINQAIQDSKEYKIYLAFATREATSKKARKFKKIASPSKKQTLKSAPAKKDVSSKKPLRKQSTGVQIRDTPGVSVSKNKAPATTDRSKGIDLLTEAALLEDAQMKKVLKWSKRETHSHQASGSGDGVGSQPKVPDELQDKTIGTDEGTGTKLGVPDVPKDQSESENESWGESGDDDDSNDDDVNDDDGNKDNSNDDGGDNDSESERTESDEDENPNLNQNDDDIEEEYKDEYVRTPSSYESTYDENEHVHEEEYDHIDKELYKDVNLELKDTYDQDEDDAHVTLTAVHDTQKTEVPLQSSSVSFDFATQFLNLDNVPPANTEINSMMNIDVRHEEPSNQTPSLLTKPVTVIPETSTATATTIPLPIPPFTPLPHQSTPTPTPTTKATTSLPAIPDFSYLCGFNQRVSILEKELSQIKQVDHSSQLLEAIKSQVPAVIEAHLGTRLGNTIQQVLKEEVKCEREKYMEFIEKSVKANVIDQVKIQLPQILPKEVSDFATPVIQSTVIESLENVILAKSSSQPQSTYEAASSLTEFELKKILLDKISSKSTKSQPKSSGKSGQAEESVFEVTNTEMPHNQGSDLGNTGKQPNVEVALKHDWFKKPERPPTPDPDWNVVKSVDFRPPQTWISKIAQAEKPPLSFDELMSTPIDFSAYVMNHLKIDNLTQDHLVGPAFNLLKGTSKSRVELEYNIEECYKAVTDRLDWNNPEGKEYPFDLRSSSKKYTTSTTKTKAAKYDIPCIEDMVPSLWSPVKVSYDRYAVWGISHWGPKRQRFYGFSSNRVSKYDVYFTKRIIAVTKVKVIKWYDYGYLEEIEVKKKLSNPERDVIFDLGVALRMFTRRMVILKRVKDLQLGVESYQKKLNITKPETFRSDISNRTPYTAYNNPQGIIYEDKYKRNRLMRTDELYKFSDGMLTSVRSVLHDIALNLRMENLPKIRWSSLDRKRSHIMIKAINKLLLERRLMMSLEKFVGGRDYGEDLRLLQRTI